MSEIETGTDQLLCDLTDKVATMTLNRPEARNALADEMTMALRKTLAWARDSDEVGAIVLTGAGGAFCAGGDVKAMGARNQSGSGPSVQQQFETMCARHHETAGALRAMRKPSIASIPGPAAGAGLALALACDLRVMADNSFVSTGYAGIGLSGDYGIAWLLTRIVGPGKARELMLLNERIPADLALQLGLVNRVAALNALQDDTFELARQLANGPQTAYRYIKDNLDDALESITLPPSSGKRIAC